MRDWDSLTLAEQTLLRGGARNALPAWSPEHYSTARRWAGCADAPLRSITVEEAERLAAELRPVALDLHDRGELFVAEATGKPPFHLHDRLPPADQRAFLADPDNWRLAPTQKRRTVLDVDPALSEHLTSFVDRLPAEGHPTFGPAEERLLVCAFEYSGWLTGAYGIWPDPPQDLDAAARLAFVDDQLAPLLPLVRNGWIEVRHVTATDSTEYTVIPADRLREAAADPSIRYEGDAWGIGLTCCLTLAGVAAWRSPRQA
ncbi:hypothetical protein [Streptacidiphilus jiangxiensis]|uniref:Uncharacterized protein n=1 Tax=Streptacidiphilus jiangxiensis TaxID=235985 RepID=A0A1H7XCL7_STRJI|nr:hypothetical protein [Streptacidiphilus jiangxiensis]SEM31405.1 hypothetical protein SAMN05414137_123104 [Streptacidiphilus jiangxiensis]